MNHITTPLPKKPLRAPIAVLSSHGGLSIPPELEGRIALSEEEIFNEADAYADQIFDFQDKVQYWLNFPYARTIIDLNRPKGIRYRHRPGDGIVKRITSYATPVYLPGKEPDAELEAALIDRYWRPWHNQLEAIAKDPQLKLVIDCHTMAAVGPATYGDPDTLRPRISVANFGDANANLHPNREIITAPPALTRDWAAQLAPLVNTVQSLTPTGPAVGVNTPYWGGCNLRGHAEAASQPWLMIEVNRGLYVGNQTAASPVVPPNEAQISALRDIIWQSLNTLLPHLEY